MKWGWHWMAASSENLSPVGPDEIPVAEDPSACLMQDKAGEGKSAKSTGQHISRKKDKTQVNQKPNAQLKTKNPKPTIQYLSLKIDSSLKDF